MNELKERSGLGMPGEVVLRAMDLDEIGVGKLFRGEMRT